MKKESSSMLGLAILLCMCVANIISVFQVSYPAVLSYDIERALNFNAGDISLMSSYALLTFGLSQVPVGILTDKFGAKKILVLFQFGIALCTFLLIFSSSANIALFSRLLVGLFLAAIVPGLKVIATQFSEAQFSKASSIMLAAAPVGSLLASSPLAFLNSAIGWQASLGIIACVALACSIAIFFLPMKEEKANSPSFVSIMTNIKALLTNKNFLCLLVWFATVLGVITCLMSFWFGRYVMDILQGTSIQAGNILFTSSLITVFGMPLWAYIGENVVKSEKKCLVFGGIVFVVLLVCLGLFPITNYWFLMLYLFIMNFFGSSLMPLCVTACKKVVPLESFGTANGFLNTVGPLIGAPLQSVFAFVVISTATGAPTATNYGYGFLVMGLCASLGVLGVVLYKEKK